MSLNERQYRMLKDVASFNYKKYRYQAMPACEIEIRDFRTMNVLLRKNLVEYPILRDRNGLPYVGDYVIRVTALGLETLKEMKGKF